MNNNKDTFYTDLYKGYLTRIPLIKPYELISSDNGFTWVLSSPFNPKRDIKYIIENIKKVGIKDSLIVVYSNMTSLPNRMSEAWGCIDATNSEELIFTEFKDYETFLKQKNISNITFLPTDTLFNKFKNGKTLIE